MIEAVIMLLIYACIVAGLIWIVFYVLGAVGWVVPPMVQKIVWIIGALILLLAFVRLVLPHLGVSLP
jgi:hypothetical protein